jgi:hypothetical protein
VRRGLRAGGEEGGVRPSAPPAPADLRGRFCGGRYGVLRDVAQQLRRPTNRPRRLERGRWRLPPALLDSAALARPAPKGAGLGRGSLQTVAPVAQCLLRSAPGVLLGGKWRRRCCGAAPGARLVLRLATCAPAPRGRQSAEGALRDGGFARDPRRGAARSAPRARLLEHMSGSVGLLGQSPATCPRSLSPREAGPAIVACAAADALIALQPTRALQSPCELEARAATWHDKTVGETARRSLRHTASAAEKWKSK